MTDLLNIKLVDLLPSNLAEIEIVRALFISIDEQLKEVALKSNLVLLYARLDELEEDLIDELAWQLHVDFYDYNLPVDQKRNLVRRSILWHRKKGTPWAVEQVVSTFLKGATIKENWEYGGNPYCFKVSLIQGSVPDTKTLDNLYKAIIATKNTRSWLDGVEFERAVSQPIFYAIGTRIFKQIDIYPEDFKMPDVASMRYITGSMNLYRRVDTWPTGMVPS